MEITKQVNGIPMLNLRTTALDIFRRTLAAIDIENVIRTNLQLNDNQLTIGQEVCNLSEVSRVLVIAIGKASVPMARTAENILGDRITDGLVVTNAVIGEAPRHFLVFTGTVPKLTAVAPDVDQSPTRARNLGLGLRSERNPPIRRDRRLFEGATGRREQVQEHRND